MSYPALKSGRVRVTDMVNRNRLGDMPHDILQRICELLPSTDCQGESIDVNLQALSSLTQTCKDLRTVTEPFLYHTFQKPCTQLRCRSRALTLDLSISWIHVHFILPKFISALIERPKLAWHVRFLHLGWWSPSHPSVARQSSENARLYKKKLPSLFKSSRRHRRRHP